MTAHNLAPAPRQSAPGTAAAIEVAVLVIGSENAARARTLQSLQKQSCITHVISSGDSLASVAAPVSLIVQAGVELEYTACERLALLLRTAPDLGWVTGGSLEVPQPLSLSDAVMSICAVRTTDARRVLGDARWQEAAHNGRGTPGLALQLVVAMHHRGLRGLSIGQPPIAWHEPSDEWTALCRQAQITLEKLGLDMDARLDPHGDGPPRIPLQRLERGLWPSTISRQAGEPAGPHRMLMLLQGFPMGGYTAFNADLIQRLVARGHHVTTACTEWWRSTWRLDQVRRVAPDIHHVPSCAEFAAIPAYIAHLIESRQIDVVFLSHSFLSYRLLPLLREAFPHVAFVDYVHTEWFEAHMYGSYATMSARYTSSLDAQVVSSRTLADALVQQGAEASRVHVAHIGIDTHVWNAAGIDRDGIRRAFGAAPESTVLLFAGRLSPEKRPQLAVDALDHLRGEGRDVRLVVAGDGPMLQMMNELLERRGLSAHAALLGEVDEDTLRQVYAASDIYFAPSEIEGIARTLYEAMALGCVPVVSDVGGQRELVVPGVGSLVPPEGNEVTPYLPALRQWCDGASRTVAGTAAWTHVAGAFDSEHTVRAIETAMSAALRQAAARSVERAADIDKATAEELAVMGLEVMRRHASPAFTNR
jgi:glycosyltransferase involved in cell wall biosynthesis